MTRKRLRWGVISTANIGRVAMIPALQKASNGDLLAVASRSQEKADEFAQRLGIPRAYGSYEALLDDPEIDAIYNPLPNNLHREWCIAAAQAGKHILCEKPLALNAQEVEEMAAAAEQHGVLLMESFMYRFLPQTERVLALIAEGAIGDLRLIQSTFTFRLTRPDNIRWRPDLGGGALMDVGCYCVNINRTLAGAEPVEVQAFATWADSGVDAEMAGSLRFAGGLVAQFNCGLTLERLERYQVQGTLGSIEVPKAFLPGDEDTLIYIHRGRLAVERLRHGGTASETLPGSDEYQQIAEHFADCALNGRPLRYAPAEAAANLRVIEALYRSARNNGRPEPVQP